MARTPDPASAESLRIRLELSYDGTAFSGWARQPGQRTVQGALEQALALLFREPEPPKLTVAGRTDAGVHARGQVAHVDVAAHAWSRVAGQARGRLAGLLPPDVRVQVIAVAPPGFDARFSALWRRYTYRVCDDPFRLDPLRRHDTLVYRRRVDISRMNEAASALIGEHDFAAYCRRREGSTTVRRLIRLEWAREGGDAVAVATVVASAFCHNMVRALVGALLAVGDGRRPATWPAEVLASKTRDSAVHVAPPHGLCLEEVRYPGERELAAHAAYVRGSRADGGVLGTG